MAINPLSGAGPAGIAGGALVGGTAGLVISQSGCGIVVPWDERAFARAISQVLDNPALGQEMGLRGRQYVEEYRTNRAVANVVEQQYLRACKPPSNQ